MRTCTRRFGRWDLLDACLDHVAPALDRYINGTNGNPLVYDEVRRWHCSIATNYHFVNIIMVLAIMHFVSTVKHVLFTKTILTNSISKIIHALGQNSEAILLETGGVHTKVIHRQYLSVVCIHYYTTVYSTVLQCHRVLQSVLYSATPAVCSAVLLYSVVWGSTAVVLSSTV